MDKSNQNFDEILKAIAEEHKDEEIQHTPNYTKIKEITNKLEKATPKERDFVKQHITELTISEVLTLSAIEQYSVGMALVGCAKMSLMMM